MYFTNIKIKTIFKNEIQNMKKKCFQSKGRKCLFSKCSSKVLTTQSMFTVSKVTLK